MYYRGNYVDSGEGREMGFKRQRLIDQAPSFYGTSPNYGASQSSSFIYNPTLCSYVGQPPPFPVVRLRGLPFDCSESDIAEFFDGLDIVDLLFVNKKGKFTGEVYCVLGYPLQVDFALQRNRQNIGRRYVEVFRSKKQEYYKAIANEVLDSRGGGSPHRCVRERSYDDGKESVVHTGFLRLRGLPFSASKDDIMEFFRKFVLNEDSIQFTMNSEGRKTGEALVQFKNGEDSKAAMVMDRQMLGSRYIELFPSSREEWEDAASRDRSNNSNNQGSSDDEDEADDEPTEVLRMRGLPYSAKKEDIIDFFKEFKLTEKSIHFTKNKKGRVSGEAYVEFSSVEDATSALSKDRMTLGSRYIELFQSSLDELREDVAKGH